jgi:hypothetical protein
MKKKYTQDLTRTQIFVLYFHRIFFPKDFTQYKNDVDNGMHTNSAFDWNFKD